jgi:hypothetical protein
MGADARAAVPAMTDLLAQFNPASMTNDDVQIARNICYALGDIGPDARAAIPALQGMSHLRVKYIAEEAIERIEGRPLARWH